MYKYRQQSVICSDVLRLIRICMLLTNCLCHFVLHILLFFLLKHKFDTRGFVQRHLLYVGLATSSDQTALQGAFSFGHMSYGRGVFFCVNLKSLEHLP